MCEPPSTATSAAGHDILGYAELCRPGAADYLERHRIPQLFRSLVAALMVQQPADHVAFVKRTLAKAIDRGVASLNWETFVYQLHPKRSPARLEYVRDGTDYERQGLELMEQRRNRKLQQQQQQPATGPAAEAAAAAAASPAPPPLSPAPSLTSSAGGGGGEGIDDLFRLTQLGWADAAGDPRAQLGLDGAPAGSGTQEFVSSEVDKLLSEAIVLSVAARDQQHHEDGAAAAASTLSPDSSSLVASLQAKLRADLGRSDTADSGEGEGEPRRGGDDDDDVGFGLFD